MDRTERFCRIQQFLRGRRIVPLEDFLGALEVSRATVIRDLEYLRGRLQVPIVWDRAECGYRLDTSGVEQELPGLFRGGRLMVVGNTLPALVGLAESMAASAGCRSQGKALSTGIAASATAWLDPVLAGALDACAVATGSLASDRAPAVDAALAMSAAFVTRGGTRCRPIRPCGGTRP